VIINHQFRAKAQQAVFVGDDQPPDIAVTV